MERCTLLLPRNKYPSTSGARGGLAHDADSLDSITYLKLRRVLHMLSIKQLNKTYDNGVKAINNVSLEIPNGMFGLLGPNGAGKSSLMRTIATLQDPDSGSITFDGLDRSEEHTSELQS